MNLKHLQLNTSTLKSPNSVMEYIIKNNIDIACLQEIVYQSDQENPLKKLCAEAGFNYFEGVHFYYKDKNLIVAGAVISKFEISDYHVLYFNTPNYKPKIIAEDDFVGTSLIADDTIQESMASRGLKHSIKSRSIPIVTLNIDNKPLRVYCLNFSVSSWATETEQMYSMAQMITSHIQFAKKMPIIASGDLNVQADSYSVGLLKTVLTHHTGLLSNTLSESHRALQTDFPEGLAVDHVFSSGLNHKNTKTEQIDFSDHKAVVSEFEMSNN